MCGLRHCGPCTVSDLSKLQKHEKKDKALKLIIFFFQIAIIVKKQSICLKLAIPHVQTMQIRMLPMLIYNAKLHNHVLPLKSSTTKQQLAFLMK